MSKPTLRELMDSTDAGDEIVRHVLTWHYNYMKEDNQKLADKENIKPYQAEDIVNNIKYMEAIKTTLTMFGVHL